MIKYAFILGTLFFVPYVFMWMRQLLLLSPTFVFKKLLPIEKSQEVKAALLSSLTMNFQTVFSRNLWLGRIILLHLQLLSILTVSSLMVSSNCDFALNEIAFLPII